MTFLDDDDLYHRDRLAQIVRTFSLVPDLCYYHNAFTLFRGNSRLGGDAPAPMTTNPVLGSFRPGSDRDAPRAESRAFLRFLSERNRERNMSSTAISREFGLTVASSFERVATLTDTFLLFAALGGTGTLAFDPTPLTMVRRHGSNTSQSGADISRRREAWEVVEGVVRASGSNRTLVRYLGLREARALIFDHLIGVPASRHELWRAMETAVRAARISGLRNTVLYSTMGLAGTVSFPWLSSLAPFITS